MLYELISALKKLKKSGLEDTVRIDSVVVTEEMTDREMEAIVEAAYLREAILSGQELNLQTAERIAEQVEKFNLNKSNLFKALDAELDAEAEGVSALKIRDGKILKQTGKFQDLKLFTDIESLK